MDVQVELVVIIITMELKLISNSRYWSTILFARAYTQKYNQRSAKSTLLKFRRKLKKMDRFEFGDGFFKTYWRDQVSVEYRIKISLCSSYNLRLRSSTNVAARFLSPSKKKTYTNTIRALESRFFQLPSFRSRIAFRNILSAVLQEFPTKKYRSNCTTFDPVGDPLDCVRTFKTFIFHLTVFSGRYFFEWCNLLSKFEQKVVFKLAMIRKDNFLILNQI